MKNVIARSQLLNLFFAASLVFSISGSSAQVESQDRSIFSFGIIADCQFCSDPGSGVRKYAASEEKLNTCVAHFNTMELEYVVHLGDFIDRDYESFGVVKPIFDKLKMPGYHVLGNHDFSVVDSLKNNVPAKLGLMAKYYDFEVKGWRFIVMDGNDVSFHAYPENSDPYKFAADYYERNEIGSPKWNGAVGEEQLAWLKKVLEKASQAGEKVVMYCHFPIFPDNVHNLWNAGEVREIIEQYDCVKAWINGHNHSGNYGIKDEIHYLTIKGMVDTEETSYAVMHVSASQLELIGFGREENRKLIISR